MDRQDFIETILEHFENPYHKGRMQDASVDLGGGNPGCGDLIVMYLRIDDDERIERASFEGDGCTISQAGGSIISEMIEGMTIDELKALGTHTMKEEMGDDVVNSRVRCATLALGTAQAAADAWRRDRQRAAEGLGPAEKPEKFEN